MKLEIFTKKSRFFDIHPYVISFLLKKSRFLVVSKNTGFLVIQKHGFFLSVLLKVCVLLKSMRFSCIKPRNLA